MDTRQDTPPNGQTELISAASFTRVSTDSQAMDDKTSIPEQLLAIRKYADRHGYEIIEEISESVSGRKKTQTGWRGSGTCPNPGR